ncbi:MAG TPA: glycosyltransferase family 4 protein [Luteibaculaceae bacterium]|nr:glycosyltransferase family 4 protein [Luteibaculaceae bacterium]
MSSLAIIDHVGTKAGMDYYTSNLAEALAELGLFTEVYSNFALEGKAKYNVTFPTEKKSNTFQKARGFIAGHFWAILAIVRNRQRLVLLHSFETGLKEFVIFGVLKLLGRKIHIILHDVEGFTGDSRWFRKIIFKNWADRVFVMNEYSRELFVSALGVEVVAKTEQIKHGNFISQISTGANRNEARIALGYEEEEPLVLFFGQIKQVKGLDILLEAGIKQDRYKLIVAGRCWRTEWEPYQKWIEQWNSDKLDLRLRFIPDSERDLLFKAADVVVLPYRKIYQSGVLIMAMSYGIPVLASDLPANREVIQDQKNGFLFKSEDVNDLRNKLDTILQNTDFCRIIGDNGKTYVEKEYDWLSTAKVIMNNLATQP